MEYVGMIIFGLIVALLLIWFVRHMYTRMINGPAGYTYSDNGRVDIVSSEEEE